MNMHCRVLHAARAYDNTVHKAVKVWSMCMVMYVRYKRESLHLATTTYFYMYRRCHAEILLPFDADHTE